MKERTPLYIPHTLKDNKGILWTVYAHKFDKLDEIEQNLDCQCRKSERIYKKKKNPFRTNKQLYQSCRKWHNYLGRKSERINKNNLTELISNYSMVAGHKVNI